VTPPLGKERLPRNFHHRPLTGGSGMGSSSSDSLDHPHHNRHEPHCHHSAILASTPKLSSISGAKTDDASMRTTSSSHGDEEETETDADRSEDMSVSISNASDQEREWVEEDEPGVYITIRALPGGIRELRRVRFRLE
jgi:Transcription factor regulating root and shoot growth via Pin3